MTIFDVFYHKINLRRQFFGFWNDFLRFFKIFYPKSRLWGRDFHKKPPEKNFSRKQVENQKSGSVAPFYTPLGTCSCIINHSFIVPRRIWTWNKIFVKTPSPGTRFVKKIFFSAQDPYFWIFFRRKTIPRVLIHGKKLKLADF